MEFYKTVSVFLIIAVFTSHGQFHPDDVGLTCFRCDDTTRDNFPLCLKHPITCPAGQVCQIRYGYGTDHHIPHFFCRTRSSCEHTLIGHPLPCQEGGYQVDKDGVCHACCETSQCVSNLTNYVRLELVASRNLFCPGHCHVGNLQQCMHTGQVCGRNRFCKVKIDHADKITGSCADDHLYPSCQRSLDLQSCPGDFTNASAYDSTNNRHCTHDCCATNECLFPHFGIHMARAVSPTTVPAVAPTWNSTSGLWERLRGSCQDTFDYTLCQSLKNDHNLCKSRLSLSMCPETCGICSAVGSYVCYDTTDLCAALNNSQPGFCDTEEGLVECPTTCDKCDQLLENVILSVLNGDAVASRPIDGSVQPPAVNTPAPVNCSSITTDDCVHFGPLCLTTFLSVICPDQCDMCANGEASKA